MSKLAPADQTFDHLSKRGEADVLMLRPSDSMVLFDGENTSDLWLISHRTRAILEGGFPYYMLLPNTVDL
jgi:hypothetical protein